MSPLAMAVLAIISAIWGASFLSIRVAAPGFGAFGLAEIRCALATVLMLVFLVARKQALWPRKSGAEVVLLGLATSAAPFVLIAYAAFTLPASTLVILQSTMPLFALLFASAARLDRITPRKVVGLLCGLAGVVLVAGWSALALDRSVVIAVFASLGAAACYAVSAVYTKIRFADVPATATTFGQFAVATVALLPFSMLDLPGRTPTDLQLANALYVGVVGTGIAFLMYFWLIANAGVVAGISAAFLNPMFGVIFAAWLLSEDITATQLAGFATILIGLTLVNVRTGLNDVFALRHAIRR
jgi:drug/metabolite transporter (DMT)-like permease